MTRTNVTFRHPAIFVPCSDEDGILATNGAQWFVELLARVQGLEVDQDPCQEDWGVVFFVRHNQDEFWIGLSWWDEGAWLAHFHRGWPSLGQLFRSVGKDELKRLVAEVHEVLASEAAISDIAWYEESEMGKANPKACPTPG